jgi:DNA-3-methyladenine glycosylase I
MLSKEEWVKLFKKTLVFTGGEIVNEFLMSTGYLQGAHDESCTIERLPHCVLRGCAVDSL